MQLRIVPTKFELGAPNSCPDNFVQVYAGKTAGQPMKKYACFLLLRRDVDF